MTIEQIMTDYRIISTLYYLTNQDYFKYLIINIIT